MHSLAFLRDPQWRRTVLTNAVGKSFWGFFAAAVVLGLICWLVKGPDIVKLALAEDLGLVASLMPRVLVALSIASLTRCSWPADRPRCDTWSIRAPCRAPRRLQPSASSW